MSFRLFRQLLSATFALAHIATLSLAIYLHPVFVSHNTIWIIGTLELALFILFINSVLYKPLFKQRANVMQEIYTSFSAFILNTVLALFVVSLQVNDKELARLKMGLLLNIWIRIVIIVLFIHFVFTIALVNLSILTYFAFDKNVWKRDIDASPAPFPFPIIIPFLFPCCLDRPDMTPLPFPSGPETTPVIRHPCTTQGACECPPKPQVISLLPQDSESNEDDTSVTNLPANEDTSSNPAHPRPRDRSSLPASETRFSIISKISKRSSVTISQSLVQIPNAAQRRMSYPVTLTIWTDEAGEV